jgi:DNA-binding NtrC family response regulator
MERNAVTIEPISILIVEDDADFRDSSVRWMQRKGHTVSAAASGAEGMSLADRQHFDVAVLDMNMPGMNGIELLQRIREAGFDMEVIILTGQGTIELAVQAMKMGACDFLTKPCPLGDLEHHCHLARERGRLRRENEQLKAIISRGSKKSELLGASPKMLQVTKLISRVAPTDKPVLITGESGTGKEVVAKAIQQASLLSSKPFVTINCAALPEQLVESELFGHQKGAFTGATSEKPGLFEVADGGTLFIDELGEMPLALQPKLLRVLEDGWMRRIGSDKEHKVTVRLITATNRDLSQRVKDGKFREDLFYRVNVLPIQLPPLRERPGDVDLLVDHFLQENWQIDDEARAAMNAYPWPGNVRELINVIQRATILADGNEITIDDLPREIADRQCRVEDSLPQPVDSLHETHASLEYGDRLDDIAKVHVFEVLQKNNGNKAKAARALGIHRRKLYRLLERFSESAQDSLEKPCQESQAD